MVTDILGNLFKTLGNGLVDGDKQRRGTGQLYKDPPEPLSIWNRLVSDYGWPIR